MSLATKRASYSPHRENIKLVVLSAVKLYYIKIQMLHLIMNGPLPLNHGAEYVHGSCII